MFDPAGFMQVANDNGNSDCSEAQQRTAMSRLYYAVFLISREFLSQEQGISFGKGSDVHRQVVKRMLDWNYDIGSDLSQLRNARNEADYDLRLPTQVIMRDFESHRDSARHIIDQIYRAKRKP